ncbi:cytochrome c oxidase, subunit VIa [Syncephalastrum racemosum]|uniref:Cytochrome c oxidase, subunit VIa n=1 Tax=Syncephalastrum racemosum TaxID=13706 RepID=A0A1X2HJ46_SYNRA|nr:cytochrome c oxidase, subunit VIa [Syncephalastrum racemosum]
MSESSFHSKFAEQRLGVKHHAGESAENWKKITLFVCIPALLGAGINAYNLYQHHQQHVKEHPHEFVNYEYMNWRVKDYFWGKNSLFFNPKVNHNMEE